MTTSVKTFLASLTALCLTLSSASHAQKKSLAAPAAENQVARPWISFQLDEHLAMQLPAPPRLLTDTLSVPYPAQRYIVADSTAVYLLLQMKLPANAMTVGSTTGPEVFYTTVTQALLTWMKAERVNQASFRTGKFEGLAVGFRVKNPAGGLSPGGIMWVLQVAQSVYVMQHWPKNPTAPYNLAEQKYFLASLKATDAPYNPPTAADWKRFRTGRFRYLDANPTTAVERTDTTQTETDVPRGLRLVYSLKWTADGYEITQRASTGPHADFMLGQTISVQITAVSGDTYSYRSTAMGFVFTGRVQKIKSLRLPGENLLYSK